MSVEVRLLDERSCRSPGESVRVEVRWEADAPPESVEVRLLWETRGRGDREEDVAASAEIHHPGVVGEETVELALPRAPWSYQGRLLQIVWLADAVLWPSGERARVELVLSPTGAPLEPLTDDEDDLTDAKL